MRTEMVIPLFPLGFVLFPHMPLTLHIFEERYKTVIGECLWEQMKRQSPNDSAFSLRVSLIR
jgi:Lon protease-like protein